jgi:hypothetical protein
MEEEGTLANSCAHYHARRSSPEYDDELLDDNAQERNNRWFLSYFLDFLK